MPSHALQSKASPSKSVGIKRAIRYLGSVAGARLTSPRKKKMERHKHIRQNIAQRIGSSRLVPNESEPGMDLDLLRHKLVWTSDMERAFMICLERRAHQGLLKKKIYPEMWREIALEMQPVAKRLLTVDQLKQKYARMKKAYKSSMSERTATGSGWDSATNTVIVSEDSELGLEQASRGGATSLSDLELSHTIFGFSTARGDRVMTPAATMTPADMMTSTATMTPDTMTPDRGDEFVDSNEPHTFGTLDDDIQPHDNGFNIPIFASENGDTGLCHSPVGGVASSSRDKGKAPVTQSNSKTDSKLDTNAETYMVGSRRKAYPSSSSSSKKSRSSIADSLESMTQSFQHVLSPQNSGLSRMLDAQSTEHSCFFYILQIT